MMDYLDILQYLTVLLNWLPGGDMVMTVFKWALAVTYGLWVFFLAVMNLWRARRDGSLTKPTLALGVPVLAVGYTLDVAVNLVILTVIFFEVPKEMTVTARLQRHKYADGWRGRISRWLARNLLDPFDPRGTHV